MIDGSQEVHKIGCFRDIVYLSMSRQLAILLIACLIFGVRARTQVYPFVSYTPRDGLIGNKVRFISQDSKGRLYFGTASGLSVYDGSRFTNYSVENGLYHNFINDVEEAGDDSVLVVLNAEKLQYIHNGKIGNIFLKDSICPVINEWIKCSNGFDYVITDDGLYTFEKDHFSKVTLTNLPGTGVERNLSHATEIDSFLVINMEVFNPAYRAPRFLIAYNFITGKTFTDTLIRDVYFSVKTPQNELLLATAKGIFMLDKAALKNGLFKLLPPPKTYPIPPNTISGRLYFDRWQNLWISTETGVLKIAPGKPFTLFSTANGLPVNGVSCFFQDREGIMWFGNDETGVVKLVDQNLQFHKHLENRFSVYDVSVPAGTDSVWMFDQQHHRVLLDHQNRRTQYVGQSRNILYRIAMGKRKFYASGPASIYQLHLASNGSFTISPLYLNPAGDESFGALLIDSAENIIGVGSSIVAVVNGRKVVRQQLDYLADNAVLTRDNFLVVVTRSMNFYIYQIDPLNPDNYLQFYKRIDWKDHNIEPRSFDMDDSGHLWIGSRRNGLFCYSFKDGEIKLRQQLTVKNGLTENFIKYVHCEGTDLIWAGSPTGLDRISFEGKNVRIENVTKASNMYLDIWKVATDHAGVAWAVTTSGLVKVFPSNDESPGVRPEIIISRFTVNNEDFPIEQKDISLKYFQNNLTFHIAVPSFFDEKKTLFSYKLDAEGKEGEWTEPASQPNMSFLNLSPGRYHLNIRSVFLHGKYPPGEASYSFLINPPWWQTWWFRLMTILLVFFVIFIFFRQYYHGQLQKQLINLEKKQLIEKERSRIAIDMHDDMGAGLSRIKVLSETIKFENQKGIVNPVHLQKISSYSEEMMDKMGEIVWALNQQNDSIDDLLAYTRSYAVDYLTSHGINCVFLAPPEHTQVFVSGEMRRNIFLSVKEVLHNVVKHAEATRVEIAINLGKQLLILIRDNGKGIDTGKVRKFGNGINYISKRMADIGGTATFKSQNGTVVALQVQLD